MEKLSVNLFTIYHTKVLFFYMVDWLYWGREDKYWFLDIRAVSHLATRCRQCAYFKLKSNRLVGAARAPRCILGKCVLF